jgi:hypothetical protein
VGGWLGYFDLRMVPMAVAVVFITRSSLLNSYAVFLEAVLRNSAETAVTT